MDRFADHTSLAFAFEMLGEVKMRAYYIVVSIDGCNNILLLVEASDIAEDITKRIEKMVGVPAPQQLLVFNSRILDTLAERRQLSQLGFRPGSTLQVFTVCPAREWVPAFPA
jgi:hypothetical protein